MLGALLLLSFLFPFSGPPLPPTDFWGGDGFPRIPLSPFSLYPSSVFSHSPCAVLSGDILLEMYGSSLAFGYYRDERLR